MKAKDLFFVLIGPDLAEEKNDQNQFRGDPPLGPNGTSAMEQLRGCLERLKSQSIHCGTGTRFIDAAMAALPGLKHFCVSPLWGDQTIIRIIDGQERIVLGNSMVMPRYSLYDQLPPTAEEDWAMELLRTSTIDSVYNLSDGSVVFLEERTLRILGLPQEMMAS